jgi:hypothetical protein
LARELSVELGAVDDSDADCWLDAVEERAIALGDALAAAVVEREAVARPVDEKSTCPTCGKQGRFQRVRQRELVTRRGPAAIAEPEYYCPCCRKAFFPADGRAGR